LPLPQQVILHKEIDPDGPRVPEGERCEQDDHAPVGDEKGDEQVPPAYPVKYTEKAYHKNEGTGVAHHHGPVIEIQLQVKPLTADRARVVHLIKLLQVIGILRDEQITLLAAGAF
jgi:hypothetical protein